MSQNFFKKRLENRFLATFLFYGPRVNKMCYGRLPVIAKSELQDR